MRRAGGAEVVRVRIAQLPSLTLALAAPLLVLLPAWSTLTTAPEWAPSKDVAEMNATATRAPAEVVMVGPSFARTDIDGPALGAALAASTPGHPLRVARFAQNLASAPAWYAILKERVYGNGLEPRLVLLVATTDYLLEVHPPASRMVGLEQHFAEPNEVLRARTWNSRLPATLQRALDRRRVLRDPVVSAFRDPLVELFFGGKNGAELAAEAGVEVFGQEHGGGTRRLLPGVEAQAAEEASEGEVRAADSYLPDIAALVAQHGGRLVVVLPPVAASKAADHQVSAEAERDIVETANALGVGLLDLRALPFTELDYSDGYHMRPDAKRVFTAELAAGLEAIGAMGTGAMQGSWVPPAFTVVREGTAPTLTMGTPVAGTAPCEVSLPFPGWEPLTDERLPLVSGHLAAPFVVSDPSGELEHLRRAPGPCSGAWILNRDALRVSTRAPGPASLQVAWNPALPARDADGEAAWWVYPGGALDFAWEAGGPEGPWQADLEVIDPSGSATVRVSFGEAVSALPEGGTLRRLRLEAAGAAGVHLRVESDAAVVVRSLTVRMAGRDSAVVRPPTARLVDFLPGAIEAEAPPALRPVELGVVRGRAAFAAPFEDTLGCSPVRVTENGELLPSGASAASTTNRPNGVVVDHVDGHVFVVTPDGSDPLTNGRAYRLAYSPERACRSKLKRVSVSRAWVYGEERIRSTVAPTPPLGASGPIRALRVRAETNAPPPPAATVTFTLRVGGEARLSRTLPVADLAGGAELLLDAPITRRDDGEAVLEVQVVGTDLPVLVSAVGLEG